MDLGALGRVFRSDVVGEVSNYVPQLIQMRLDLGVKSLLLRTHRGLQGVGVRLLSRYRTIEYEAMQPQSLGHR